MKGQIIVNEAQHRIKRKKKKFIKQNQLDKFFNLTNMKAIHLISIIVAESKTIQAYYYFVQLT